MPCDILLVTQGGHLINIYLSNLDSLGIICYYMKWVWISKFTKRNILLTSVFRIFEFSFYVRGDRDHDVSTGHHTTIRYLQHGVVYLYPII
jgi:hypothetical protein